MTQKPGLNPVTGSLAIKERAEARGEESRSGSRGLITPLRGTKVSGRVRWMDG